MLYDFEVTTIDGKKASLGDYRGKVMLLVNVASECGLTPQYDGLEKLNQTYAPKGLRVLGFPANEFGAQEPGTNAEIQAFCRKKFGVKFPMFAKMVVKGEGQSPLYAYLTSEGSNPGFFGDITWNFEKFLVDRDGNVVGRFAPDLDPMDPVVTAAIEEVLG